MTIGIWQIAIVLVAVAFLFGGRRLASWGMTAGRSVGRLKRGVANAKGDGEEGSGKDDLVDTVAEVVRVADQVRKVTRPFK